MGLKCYIIIFGEVNQHTIKQYTNLSSYLLNCDFSTSCIDKSQPKDMHIVSACSNLDDLELIHGVMLEFINTSSAISHLFVH